MRLLWRRLAGLLGSVAHVAMAMIVNRAHITRNAMEIEVSAPVNLHLVAVDLFQRQIKPEGGAHPQLAHHLHAAAVLLQHAPQDGKAQARADLRVPHFQRDKRALKGSPLKAWAQIKQPAAGCPAAGCAGGPRRWA